MLFLKPQSKKKLRYFGFEAIFLRVYIVNRCSLGHTGFTPGLSQTLRGYSFAALGLKGHTVPLLKDLSYICKDRIRKNDLLHFEGILP